MLLVEEPTFPLAHDLKLVALQGVCRLQNNPTASGGKYVVANQLEAGAACLNVVERARLENAHLALIPELAIPLQAVPELIEKVRSNTQPLIVIGGIEGIPPDEYRALVAQHGGIPDVPVNSPGTYVNAMLVVLRTSTHLRVFFRAKRYASGPENAGGPQMAAGTGEFLVLRLGSAPFVVAPLICSEFVWPELWNTLRDETGGLEIEMGVAILERRITYAKSCS